MRILPWRRRSIWRGEFGSRVGKGASAPCPPSIRIVSLKWWARFALPTLRTTKSMQSHLPSLPAQHRLLARDAPVIAGQRAALAERAMAGHHERHRIAADGGADGARGLRALDLVGD